MSNITTIVIPAAGYGTRMQGITRGGSKELLEVGGKPAIMYALQEAIESGLSRAAVTIRQGKEDIVDVLRNNPRFSYIRRNIDIALFYQEKPTGEAGAIATAKKWIEDALFVVHYPDNIIAEPPGTMQKLIRCAEEQDSDLVLLTTQDERSQAKPCGLEPEGDGLYLMHPDQTPAEFPYGLRPTGIYVASAEFLQTCMELTEINRKGEIKDRDVMQLMKIKNRKLYGLDLSARVLDIGNPDGYGMACEYLST